MREDRLGLGVRRRPPICFEEESCFAMEKGGNRHQLYGTMTVIIQLAGRKNSYAVTTMYGL